MWGKPSAAQRPSARLQKASMTAGPSWIVAGMMHQRYRWTSGTLNARDFLQVSQPLNQLTMVTFLHKVAREAYMVQYLKKV